jgi:hypothetical protein
MNDGPYSYSEMLLDQAVIRRVFKMLLYLSAEAPATAMLSQRWQ